MLYALIIYENPSDWEKRDPAAAESHIGAWRSYFRAVSDAGIYAGGNALDVPDNATTLRLRDNKRQIQDGPYANTKEQLGGMMVLDLPSLDDALDWAARCPAASYGAIEVRPVATETDEYVTGERQQR